jgi:hypothetical protein
MTNDSSDQNKTKIYSYDLVPITEYLISNVGIVYGETAFAEEMWKLVENGED